MVCFYPHLDNFNGENNLICTVVIELRDGQPQGLVRTSILFLTMSHNAASHAEGTDLTRVCASFLLIQL